MAKIKKLFGGIEMTWPKVIIMAVITAVYTALINQVPFLKETSFQDIAISFECWILFAIIIIVNCKKWWEASLKCFVFFLISQPLIYLIEVPFLGWGVFGYYKYWFIVTLLTLPGAVACYQLKRRDWISLLALSVANAFLAYIAAKYLNTAIADFPHHLLSAIFCIATAVLYVFVFLDKKQLKIAGIAIIAAVFIGVFAFSQTEKTQTLNIGDGDWTYTITDESIVEVEMLEDGNVKFKAKDLGNASVIFKDADGNEQEYCATVTGGGIFVNKFEE